METDAIEKCIGCTQFGGWHSEVAAVNARGELDALLARIRELEPQWLPAGQLPDADGWWLWATGNCIGAVKVHMSARGPEYEGPDCFNYAIADNMDDGDRFARLPAYTAPGNGGGK